MGINLEQVEGAVDPPSLFSDPGSMIEGSGTVDRDALAGGEEGAAEEPIKLEAILEKYPHLKSEIEESLVKPAATAAERDAYTRGATESEPALRERIRIDGLRERYDTLSVKAMKDGDKAAGAQALEIKAELDRFTSAGATLQQMQRQVVDEVLVGVLGIDPKAVPAEARKDFATLRAWSLTQSPHIRAAIGAATAGKQKDDSDVEGASRAAKFGTQLATTPAPNTGAAGAAGGGGTAVVNGGKVKTYQDIERGYIEGTIGFEEYSKARATNPNIRPRI